ncbi:MAG TPA: glycosyltransferase [Bryobacteraceae bacterium]|nr:glycosyltransferase [Bryobacteraceae bacterium]
MNIKTLHVTNYWHSESGGIATFYRELLKSAERLARPMRLVVPGPQDREEQHGRFGKIYYVAGEPSRLSPGYWVIMPKSYLLPHSPLRRILAAEMPDLVEVCDKYTLNYLAALLRRRWLLRGDYRPSVVALSCERMDENVANYVSRARIAMQFCRAYMKWLHFPMFDHHIVVSPHAASELRDASRGHNIRRGVWLRPMGVDSVQFRPERADPDVRRWLLMLTGAAEGGTLLLYAGRLALEKNLPLLVETMEMLERESPGTFHLIVAGNGPARAEFERDCERRVPGAIRFLGHLGDRDLLADILANCDIFLHPNPREPFGITPLEAMASGLALIAPASGGVTCYANDRNAWLVNADAASFARAVREICHDPIDAALRRRAARQTAERFDWSRVTDGFFDLYDELHELVCGRRREPSMQPAFFSTPGDRWGHEI